MLKLAATGAGATALSGWLPVLAARAAEVQAQPAATAPTARPKRCILLWMDGGPSHKDTFDMKPGTPNASPYRAINTNVSGIQISEHFPRVAQVMNHGVIVRSMSTLEGAHPRARFHLHTGYREGQGGLVYPSMGSIAAKEIGSTTSPLPNFVAIGRAGYSSGFLGARHQPLNVVDANRGVENLQAFVSQGQLNNRLGLLNEMEQGFYGTYQSDAAQAHRTTYQRAVQLMQSSQARAFDISNEPANSRNAYGNTAFGRGCLLARRLVETGVSFVEVGLGGWDTHNNNNTRVAQLSAQVDTPMAQLVKDLADRGLLSDTLVIWMGEFGRTPRMNARAGGDPGRDHYPRAWSLVMFGGGIRGGRVVGRTDSDAGTVTDRPVNCIQFMATVCRILGIDHTKMNNTPNGRPVRIVDRGGEPVREIIG